MEEKNMTALVSCFARSYHYKNNKLRIFSDDIAGKILTNNEYNSISNNMAKGIKFFNPKFVGNREEGLRWIVDNQLSPSILGRSTFCEKSLETAIKMGCRQYLIFASGYDTFAYRNKFENLKVFEIDKKEMIEDKIKRLHNSNIDCSNISYIKCDFNNETFISSVLNSNYNKQELSFNSLLGISYYLTKEEFVMMIKVICSNICNGSSIVIDYPTYERSRETKINEDLAYKAQEEMKAKYTYQEMEELLESNGLLIYEHLNNQEMTNNYFEKYNTLNPNHLIIAPKGVEYILAVKQ